MADEANRNKVDFDLLALRAKYDIPEGWEVSGWERKNFKTKSEYIEFHGAVVEATFRSGPRKGFKNWAKANRKDGMSLPLTFAEMDKARSDWSAETGLCNVCVGNGTKSTGWSAKDGMIYKHCDACDGTGKAAK